jgi:hypothetical protein
MRQTSNFPVAHMLSAAPTASYDRLRDLPRLLRLWPAEVGKLGPGEQLWLVRRLSQILRTERQLGLSRHWSYDLSRHAALLRAWRAEQAKLTGAVGLAAGQRLKQPAGVQAEVRRADTLAAKGMCTEG